MARLSVRRLAILNPQNDSGRNETNDIFKSAHDSKNGSEAVPEEYFVYDEEQGKFLDCITQVQSSSRFKLARTFLLRLLYYSCQKDAKLES